MDIVSITILYIAVTLFATICNGGIAFSFLLMIIYLNWAKKNAQGNDLAICCLIAFAIAVFQLLVLFFTII